MSWKMPLELELDALGNPENFELFIHEHFSHIATGLTIGEVTHVFPKPIDVSKERHNIVHEGEPKFKVVLIPDEYIELLMDFKEAEITVYSDQGNQTLYIGDENSFIALQFELEVMEDYMIPVITELDSLPDGVVKLKTGRLDSISTLPKVFESTIPVRDNEDKSVDEVTMRDTAEIGITLEIDSTFILITKPDQDLAVKGVFKMAQSNEEILALVAENKIRRSRQL